MPNFEAEDLNDENKDERLVKEFYRRFKDRFETIAMTGSIIGVCKKIKLLKHSDIDLVVTGNVRLHNSNELEQDLKDFFENFHMTQTYLAFFKANVQKTGFPYSGDIDSFVVTGKYLGIIPVKNLDIGFGRDLESVLEGDYFNKGFYTVLE